MKAKSEKAASIKGSNKSKKSKGLTKDVKPILEKQATLN